MKKYFLKWKEYDRMVKDLAKQIQKDGKKYSIIATIPRGGLPLATSLAHKLDVKQIIFVSGNMKAYQTESLLITDDISDSGETLNRYSNFDIATLYYKPQSKVKPKYYAEEVDNKTWIVFPWELADEEMRRDKDEID